MIQGPVHCLVFNQYPFFQIINEIRWTRCWIGCCSYRALQTSVVTYHKLYSRKHEWVEVLDDTDHVKVGITEYAAEALGDVVFAQLPAVGEEVSKGAECGAVESVKAASDLYTPVSGTVINTNQQVRLSH